MTLWVITRLVGSVKLSGSTSTGKSLKVNARRRLTSSTRKWLKKDYLSISEERTGDSIWSRMTASGQDLAPLWVKSSQWTWHYGRWMKESQTHTSIYRCDHHARASWKSISQTITLSIIEQAYHSTLNEVPDVRQVGNLAVLPFRTRIRGPAPIGILPIWVLSRILIFERRPIAVRHHRRNTRSLPRQFSVPQLWD